MAGNPQSFENNNNAPQPDVLANPAVGDMAAAEDPYLDCRCFGDGNVNLGLSDQDLASAMTTLKESFGEIVLTDANGNVGLDLNKDGTADFSFSRDGVDTDGDGRTDLAFTRDGVDVDGDGQADIKMNPDGTLANNDAANARLASLAQQLNGANPDHVGKLLAAGAMIANGMEPNPAQKESILAAADAVCAKVNALLEAGGTALAGSYGELLSAFSSLNAAGKEGFFKQGPVGNAMNRVLQAMKDIALNHSNGSPVSDSTIAYSHRYTARSFERSDRETV